MGDKSFAAQAGYVFLMIVIGCVAIFAVLVLFGWAGQELGWYKIPYICDLLGGCETDWRCTSSGCEINRFAKTEGEKSDCTAKCGVSCTEDGCNLGQTIESGELGYLYKDFTATAEKSEFQLAAESCYGGCGYSCVASADDETVSYCQLGSAGAAIPFYTYDADKKTYTAKEGNAIPNNESCKTLSTPCDAQPV